MVSNNVVQNTFGQVDRCLLLVHRVGLANKGTVLELAARAAERVNARLRTQGYVAGRHTDSRSVLLPEAQRGRSWTGLRRAPPADADDGGLTGIVGLIVLMVLPDRCRDGASGETTDEEVACLTKQLSELEKKTGEKSN